MSAEPDTDMYSPLMHLVPVLTHTTTIFFISGSRVITIPAITFVALSVSIKLHDNHMKTTFLLLI